MQACHLWQTDLSLAASLTLHEMKIFRRFSRWLAKVYFSSGRFLVAFYIQVHAGTQTDVLSCTSNEQSSEKLNQGETDTNHHN